MKMIKFITDLGITVTMTKEEMEKVATETIKFAVNDKGYDIDELSTEFVCQDITGHLNELWEEGFSHEAYSIVDDVLTKIKKPLNVTFVSEWEDGIEICTNAKYNVITGLVFDIESTEGIDEDDYEVQTLENEFIRLEDGTEINVIEENGQYKIYSEKRESK